MLWSSFPKTPHLFWKGKFVFNEEIAPAENDAIFDKLSSFEYSSVLVKAVVVLLCF